MNVVGLGEFCRFMGRGIRVLWFFVFFLGVILIILSEFVFFIVLVNF